MAPILPLSPGNQEDVGESLRSDGSPQAGARLGLEGQDWTWVCLGPTLEPPSLGPLASS